MFMLRKMFRFEASHRLPHHDGKCARLHGHSWVGWIEVSGDKLVKGGPKQGMLVDYGDLGDALKRMVEDYLDHYHLNESLDMESPTSESIAEWVYNYMEPRVHFDIKAIEIEETCTTSCRYEP